MAMFGGGGRQNSQNNNGYDVKTFSTRFTGDNSMLSTQYWDTKLSITFYPVTGVDDRGFKQYNRDDRISTTMKSNDAVLLYNEAKDLIFPEIEKSVKGEKPTPISVGTMKGTQTRNLWCLEYRPDENGEFCTYLACYSSLTEDNKSGRVFEHKFAKREIVLNYNKDTGTAESVMREMDFFIFMEMLHTLFYVDGVIGHSVEYISTVHAARQSNRAYNGGANTFNQGNNNQPKNEPATVQDTFDTGDDLPF